MYLPAGFPGVRMRKKEQRPRCDEKTDRPVRRRTGREQKIKEFETEGVREKLRAPKYRKSRKFMVNVQQICMFLKSTTGEHEQNGTGLLHIY